MSGSSAVRAGALCCDTQALAKGSDMIQGRGGSSPRAPMVAAPMAEVMWSYLQRWRQHLQGSERQPHMG